MNRQDIERAARGELAGGAAPAIGEEIHRVGMLGLQLPGKPDTKENADAAELVALLHKVSDQAAGLCVGLPPHDRVAGPDEGRQIGVW